MRNVATGTFIDEAGKVVRASAVTTNRWTSALADEVRLAGEELVRVRLPPGYDPRVIGANLHHAEMRLLQWAQERGYRIISIGSGKPICGGCNLELKIASDEQLAVHGFPIFFQ